MYVVKLKYKESNEICYANNFDILNRKELRNERIGNFSWFKLSLAAAKQVYKNMCEQEVAPVDNQYGWVDPNRKLEYISIVELSNYEPHSEYQVLEYREFK